MDLASQDGDENSSDGTDSHLCLSDDEDIFDMQTCVETALSAAYKKSFLYLKSRAVAQVARDWLRDDPLVPLNNTDITGSIMNVDDPGLWPSWHCPFKNCTAHGVPKAKRGTVSVTSKHIFVG